MNQSSFCTSCGHETQESVQFCTSCGSPNRPSPQEKSREGSLERSLENLGLRLTKFLIIRFAIAVAAGVGAGFALPVLYGPVVAPLLDVVFGAGASPTRDGFNTAILTGFPLAISFLVSYVSFRNG